MVHENDLVERTSVKLAHFILYMQSLQKSCIKETELNKIFARIKGNDYEYRVKCINRASVLLENLIGVKVNKVKTFRGYRLYVRNALQMKDDVCPNIGKCFTDEDKAKYGLLIAILMFLYMRHRPGSASENYTVSETLLQNFLKMMRLRYNNKFGIGMDLYKLLAGFVSQGWLTCKKEVDENLKENVTYEWGPRAQALTHPLAILQAYCTADGSTPENWKSHYQKAQTASAEYDKQRIFSAEATAERE